MDAINLHIFPTDLHSQTRLFKEAEYTISRGIVDRVVCVGLHRDGDQVEEILPSGLELIRVKTLLRKYHLSPFAQYRIFRALLIIFSLLQYAAACFKHAFRLKPQHVSCHYLAMLPLSVMLARLFGATLEYLPHELETQRSGLSGVKKKVETWLERRFIHFSRNVVVVCDPIREWYSKAYGLTNLHVIRNVPEENAVQLKDIPEGSFRQRFAIPDSARVFIYQGLFSPGRGIETLIDAFKVLDPYKSHIVFMGYGDAVTQYQINEASILHSNIHFQPPVEREWIVSYTHGADVGVFVSENATLSYRFALPNKFFEYAHAGVPMLVSDNLEYQANILTSGGFGWATPLDKLEYALLEVSELNLTPFSDKAKAYAANAVWEEDAKAFASVYCRAER